MPTVILPSSLHPRSAGLREIDVPGTTAGETLRAVETRLPGLKGWILDEQGSLRQHVNVFVDNRRVTLDHPTSADQQIFVIQAITGGNNG